MLFFLLGARAMNVSCRPNRKPLRARPMAAILIGLRMLLVLTGPAAAEEGSRDKPLNVVFMNS